MIVKTVIEIVREGRCRNYGGFRRIQFSKINDSFDQVKRKMPKDGAIDGSSLLQDKIDALGAGKSTTN
jgi:hypothetical protein